jgi:Holliday junction resolvase RusA-like endonuclease
MNRLLGIVVTLLQLQWTIQRVAIGAYGFSSTATLHRRKLTFIPTTSIPWNTTPRPRPKRTSIINSASQKLQDRENSTSTTTTITPVVAADDDVDTTILPPKTKTRRTKQVSTISQNSHTDPQDDSDSVNTTNNKVELQGSIPPPTHWIVDSDKVIYQEIYVPVVAAVTNVLSSSTTSTVPSVFHCTIRGNPLPLRRHRTRRGFIYNPSAATQLTFRNLILRIIESFSNAPNRQVASSTQSTNNVIDHPVTIPLWDIDQPIAVSIVFRMKRPNRHFIGNKPFAETTTKSKKNTTAISRLRDTAPKVTCTTSMRTDIDNLAKFVLDSLNNVTYADDKQIVSLHVIKLFDNDMTNQYQGSTTITIRLLHDDDMTTHLIEQQQQILSITPSSETQNTNNNMF